MSFETQVLWHLSTVLTANGPKITFLVFHFTFHNHAYFITLLTHGLHSITLFPKKIKYSIALTRILIIFSVIKKKMKTSPGGQHHRHF